MKDEFNNRLPMFQMALTDEIADYQAVITAPQQSIAGHKAKRLQLRDRFREVEAKFDALDTTIVRFDKTDAGRNLIAAFKAARIIRDLGHGPGTGGNGGNGNGTTAPVALQIDLLTQNGTSVDVGYAVDIGSEDATHTLLWQIVGVDTGFDNSAPATPNLQTIGPFMPGQTIRFKTRATNSAGTTDGPEVEIALT